MHSRLRRSFLPLLLVTLPGLVVASCSDPEGTPGGDAGPGVDGRAGDGSPASDATGAGDLAPGFDSTVPPPEDATAAAADGALPVDAPSDAAADTGAADTDAADTGAADTGAADTGAADSGTDAAPPVDAAQPDAGPANCGPGPYAALDPLSAIIVVTGGSTSPVTISANNCPATTVVVKVTVTGTTGNEDKSMNVTKGVPFFLTGAQDGSLPSFGAEYNLPTALNQSLPSFVLMYDPGVPAFLANPAWDASKMSYFELGIDSVKNGSTAPCATKDGVTYAVTNHPEAVIKYEGGGTTTSTKGHAYVTIETTGTGASPEYVTVSATKPGCQLGPTAVNKLLLTGRTPVARGTTSIAPGFELSN